MFQTTNQIQLLGYPHDLENHQITLHRFQRHTPGIGGFLVRLRNEGWWTRRDVFLVVQDRGANC